MGEGLPGIFEPLIFHARKGLVPPSVFLRAMHPKTEISPTPAAVEKILRSGWVGQIKIHGHRAQIHLPADAKQEMIAYNRQGRRHAKLLPPNIVKELRRLFDVQEGWTVLDCEWVKPEDKLYIFDILKRNGENLRRLTYSERYELLPRSYISPHIQTLPLLKTVDKCMQVLHSQEEHIEGLVFKSPTTKGFEDTSIVRCRKRPTV
jgi:ATP-dependent DNA ligase